MKKILAISMVLVLMVGAVFAETETSAKITTQVAAGQGAGEAVGGATIGDGSTYGYIICYGDGDNAAIDSNDHAVSNLSAATAGDYTFILKYVGKEAKGAKHKVTVSCADGWVLSSLTQASSANTYQKNAMNSIAAACGSDAVHDSVKGEASEASITTTFGYSDNQTPVTTAKKVGTYTLSWQDSPNLEVGTYRATVTFVIGAAD